MSSNSCWLTTAYSIIEVSNIHHVFLQVPWIMALTKDGLEIRLEKINNDSNVEWRLKRIHEKIENCSKSKKN